jgi:integrase
VLKAKATAIRDVVIRASEKAFPDLKNKPTAYSFRHDFASQLKAANGEDSVITAAALGHASTKTQGCYGYVKSGRSGGVVCRQATASDPIRTPRTSREQRLSKKPKLKI